MKATLYLQYKQAALTIDLTQHIEAVHEILGGSVYDKEDERVHRFYYAQNPMRDILNRLRTNLDIRTMLSDIQASMRKLDASFYMDEHLSTVNPSVFTIDTRS